MYMSQEYFAGRPKTEDRRRKIRSEATQFRDNGTEDRRPGKAVSSWQLAIIKCLALRPASLYLYTFVPLFLYTSVPLHLYTLFMLILESEVSFARRFQ